MFTEEMARAELLAHKERTGKTQSAIAKEMGISDGQLSSFLSGTYKTPHTIMPKIERLVSVSIKKAVDPKEPEFKLISTSGAIIDLITYCQIRGKVSIAYGDAGVGKTMGILQYQKKNPDNMVLLTISPCFSSVAGVSDLVADALQIKETVARRVFIEAVKRLRGSNKVIVIDEAQHLTIKSIEYLRCMADESGVGMAFIGNEAIYSKMIGSGRGEYAQLYSRIAHRDPVRTKDITKKDVVKIFEDFGLDEMALDVLYQMSHTNYGLRGAVNVFVNTAAAFGEVSAKGLSRVAKEIGVF